MHFETGYVKNKTKKITAVCNYLQHSPLKHYVKHKFKEFHCGINLLLWSVSNDLLKKQKCWTGNCFGLPVLCHWRFTILSVYLHSFLCDFFTTCYFIIYVIVTPQFLMEFERDITPFNIVKVWFQSLLTLHWMLSEGPMGKCTGRHDYIVMALLSMF